MTRLSLPERLPAAAEILAQNAAACVREIKTLGSKIIVTGDVDSVLLYRCDAGALHAFSFRTEFSQIIEAGCQRSESVADSASPQMIAELRARGIPNIRPSKKGAGSIEAGIKRLQDYEIIVNECCPNVIIEFSNYAWKKDAQGQLQARPIDEYNHAIDAMRYATEGISSQTFSW